MYSTNPGLHVWQNLHGISQIQWTKFCVTVFFVENQVKPTQSNSRVAIKLQSKNSSSTNKQINKTTVSANNRTVLTGQKYIKLINQPQTRNWQSHSIM